MTSKSRYITSVLTLKQGERLSTLPSIAEQSARDEAARLDLREAGARADDSSDDAAGMSRRPASQETNICTACGHVAAAPVDSTSGVTIEWQCSVCQNSWQTKAGAPQPPL